MGPAQEEDCSARGEQQQSGHDRQRCIGPAQKKAAGDRVDERRDLVPIEFQIHRPPWELSQTPILRPGGGFAAGLFGGSHRSSHGFLQSYFRPPPAFPPTLPAPAVPVRACSRRHCVRSCPVSVSHRPLERSGSGAAVAPLAPTLVSGARWLMPCAPDESVLVPVEGSVGGSGRGCTLPPTPGLFAPMFEPDCV